MKISGDKLSPEVWILIRGCAAMAIKAGHFGPDFASENLEESVEVVAGLVLRQELILMVVDDPSREEMGFRFKITPKGRALMAQSGSIH